MKQFWIIFLVSLLLLWCNETADQQEPDILSVDDVLVPEQPAQQELEEPVPVLDLLAANFNWNGTEPFWGFNASGSTLVLREPSDTGPMDLTTFTGVVMTNVGTSVNMTAPGMNLNLVLWTCSDGMSDIVYDYSSSFVAGVLSYTGCANID
jgi:uncharacterized membrane protein